jgi:dihydrofolate reductase
MAHVTLYIATSLDGYIARRDGGIDWLDAVQRPDTDYGYQAFYNTIHAVMMGRKTYDLARGFGDWPYPGMPSYVFTRQALRTDRDDVFFSAAPPAALIRELESRGLERLWLVGGGELVAAFQRERLIDEYIVSIIPLLLGEGIPLFPPPAPALPLALVESQSFPSGLVQLRYQTIRQQGANDVAT